MKIYFLSFFTVSDVILHEHEMITDYFIHVFFSVLGLGWKEGMCPSYSLAISESKFDLSYWKFAKLHTADEED